MKRKFSWELAKYVMRYLDGFRAMYHFDVERGVIWLPLPAENTVFVRQFAYFVIGDIGEDIELDLEFPIQIPYTARNRVGRFIVECCDILDHGNIQMNLFTGRLCFHSNIDCFGGMPNYEQLARAVTEVSVMNSAFGAYLLYLALGVPVQQDDDTECDFGDMDENDVEDPFDPEWDEDYRHFSDEDDYPDEEDPDEEDFDDEW